jgi:kynurenine formamidase
MKTIDLTHLIHPRMPVFPGTPQPELTTDYNVAEHGFMETRLNMLSHTGTHMDAPAHMLLNGITLDKMPVSTFLGNAVCIDLTGVTGEIELHHLEFLKSLEGSVDFVLMNSGWSGYWGTPGYFTGFPVLTTESAEFLTTLNLKGIGADFISFDRHDSATYPVHHILLGKGLILIENLANLSQLPEKKSFWFAALPLNYQNADGCPIRAVAQI